MCRGLLRAHRERLSLPRRPRLARESNTGPIGWPAKDLAAVGVRFSREALDHAQSAPVPAPCGPGRRPRGRLQPADPGQPRRRRRSASPSAVRGGAARGARPGRRPAPPRAGARDLRRRGLADRVKPMVVNITTRQQVSSARGARPVRASSAPQRPRGRGGDARSSGRRSAPASSSTPPGTWSPTSTWSTAPSEVRVHLADEREFVAEVVGRDPKLDLALLKLKGAKDLPAARARLERAAPRRRARPRRRQPLRPRPHRDARHRQRQGAQHRRRALRRLHPDRRQHQPGQQRRSALQLARRGGRHQHRHPRRRQRHRLRHPHRRAQGRPAASSATRAASSAAASASASSRSRRTSRAPSTSTRRAARWSPRSSRAAPRRAPASAPAT